MHELRAQSKHIFPFCSGFRFQVRKHKRNETMDRKRLLGGNASTPFLIAIVPLHEQIDAQSALAILKSCDPNAIIGESATGVTHIT